MITHFASCPACASSRMEIFFQLDDVPVHQNLLMPNRGAAQQCSRGDIRLGFCPACGFIANLAFEIDRLSYSQDYENSQSYSPLFRDYMEDLAASLISRYKLYNKKIIEIGCGNGEFLIRLCELGQNQGIGFDPSYIEEANTVTDRVIFIQDFYSEQYANYQGDFVYCRHVLEHIQEPAQLVSMVQHSAKDRPDSIVFFEVPNVTWILCNLTFWDIFYEHCSYFSAGSLARLFARSGFEVAQVTSAFNDQYLWLEAFPQSKTGQARVTNLETPHEMAEAVAYFAEHYQEKMDAQKHQIFDQMEQSKRTVIWGAGAKGVTILNTLNVPLESIEYVVDINPRKQGMYIPGTGQQIVPPEFLKVYSPDTIFVMNPNYHDEIHALLTRMGLEAELISL